MRITIEVGQLTPAQVDWLNGALRESYEIGQDEPAMCVQFTLADGVTRHVEMPAGEWVKVVSRLHRLTRTAEAVLTPDSMSPDVMWGALPRERYEAMYRAWSGL